MTSDYQEHSQESRFGVKSIKFGKGNLKKITVWLANVGKTLKNSGKCTENYVKKDLNACLKTKL